MKVPLLYLSGSKTTTIERDIIKMAKKMMTKRARAGKVDKSFTLSYGEDEVTNEFVYMATAPGIEDFEVTRIAVDGYKPDYNEVAIKKFEEYIENYKKEILTGIRSGKTISTTTTTKSGNIYLPKHITKSILNKENVLLVSSSGAGKTHSVLALMEELKTKKQVDEIIEITFSTGMDDFDLLTKFVPDEKGSIKSIEGQLMKAFEFAKAGKKVAVLLDELTRTPAKSLNILIGVLDKVRDKYRLDNFIKGIIVEAPIENLFFVGTANIGGRYEGTFTLDEALLDRFEKVAHLTYSDILETELIKTRFPAITGEQLKVIKSDVIMLREALNQNLLESSFSTRMLKNVLRNMISPSQVNFRRVLEEVVLYRLLPKKPDGSPIMENLDLIFGIKAKSDED